MGCNICECRHLIIVLSAAKVGCGRGGWGLLRWMLLTTITTEAQFRSWCGVHCMCNGFLLQSLWESTHVQAAHTLHGGSYSKSRGLICMIYMLHLRSPPPSPPPPLPKPHMWQRIQLPPTRHPPHPTHVSYHDRDIPGIPQKRDPSCAPQPLAGERQSANRLRREPEKCLRTERLRGSRDLSASDGVLWRVFWPEAIYFFREELSDCLPTKGGQRLIKNLKKIDFRV